MRGLKQGCLISFCVLVSTTPVHWTVAQDQRGGLNEIKAAWKARSERTQTGQIQWDEVCFYPRGSMTKGMIDVPKKAIIPKEDTELRSSCQIVFDKSRINYSRDGAIWSSSELKPVEHKSVSVFDGAEARNWYDPEGDQYATGFIPKRKIVQDINSLRVNAITLHYRPLDAVCGFNDLQRCIVDAKRTSVRGVRCVVMRRLRGTAEDVWYLDPGREYVVVRAETAANGKVRQYYDVEYESSIHGVIPSSWKGESNYNTGVLRYSFKCAVKRASINGSIDADRLSEPFPKGTVVYDTTLEDTSDKHSYIVLDSGGKRYITHGERLRNVTHSELLTTESGMGGLPRSWKWRPVAFWVLLAASAVVIALAWTKRGGRSWRSVADGPG